ncbi:MAG: FAD-dependent oxidoreductase [Thermoleophilia bacterium]|jgi:tRNA U34 5-carboxymethylaminomethyl modifying enzyme MnmG/GidA
MNDQMDIPSFDVLVIGAGPAGSEASLAAAAAGSRTLCLTINLDTAGYPPATPALIDGPDDPRVLLLEEMTALGARLPDALAREGVVAESRPAGKLLIDRRLLGLAYKELLENEEGLELRQALVTSLEPSADGWIVGTKLGEYFSTATVVIAAGTFLRARVNDGGSIVPGGRIGEIPANALAKYLQNAGLQLIEVEAATMPRVDIRSLDHEVDYKSKYGIRLLADGRQLGEMLGYGLQSDGNRDSQLRLLRMHTGLSEAWVTRASYSVLHYVLAAGQIDANLEARTLPGLFFAGRAAGSCSYLEAATLGLLAGRQAASRQRAHEAGMLISSTIYVSKLCQRIAEQESRPVTIRTDEPGC